MHSDSYQYLDTVVFERLLLYIAIYLATIALYHKTLISIMET